MYTDHALRAATITTTSMRKSAALQTISEAVGILLPIAVCAGLLVYAVEGSSPLIQIAAFSAYLKAGVSFLSR